MRHLLALSLVVMTGCGDDLAGDGASGGVVGDTDGPVQDDGVVPRLVPQVCATRSWPEVQVEDKDLDLAVVATATGATVLHVPRSGGLLGGFQIDGRGLIIGDPIGTKLLDGKWTDVSASVRLGRLMVGLSDGEQTQLGVLSDDLGAHRTLGTATGGVLGDAVMIPTRGGHVTATGGAGGLVLTTFGEGWGAPSSQVVARSVPTVMTSAAYGDDAMVAWSTTTSCHLQRVIAGASATQDFACPDARIATSFVDRGGQMVWQRGGSVMLSNLGASAHNEIMNANVLVGDGWSPRVTFDGARYWVSFLNSQGDVVVGYLDEDDRLVTAMLDLRPLPGAHELVVIEDAVWAFGYDAETGFGASRLCLVRE